MKVANENVTALLINENAFERQDLQKDDRPFPPRELTELKGNTISGENGYYYPTGFVPFNVKPLKSCLSNSNLSSMGRRGSEPKLSSRSNMSRNVSFHQVEIREYERAVGNNPCTTGGTSLSLGWKYNPDHTVVDFEPYEVERLKRSASSELSPVPDMERKRILMVEANATEDELQCAKDTIFLVRGQRKRTVKLQELKCRRKLESLEESLQSAKRKIRRFLSATSKAKEEEKLWKNAEKALKKRTALLKKQSTGDLTQSSSSDSLRSDNSTTRHINSSSGWSITSFESEVENSLSNEMVNSSITAKDTSNSDDWEFSYNDKN